MTTRKRKTAAKHWPLRPRRDRTGVVMTTLRERLAQMGEDIAYEEKVVDVPVNVAAGLVAVAVAVAIESREYCPLCGYPPGVHVDEKARRLVQATPCPMHKLAVALGVSR